MCKIFRITFLFFCMEVFSFSLYAQGESKITAGIASYDSGEYEKAATLLEEGLKFPETLNGDFISKGHYYLGLAYVRLQQKAILENESAILDKYPEPALMAFYHFRRSLETDVAGRWKLKTQAEIEALEPMLMQTGLTYFNMGTTSGQLKAQEKKVVLELAYDYFDALTQLAPTHYVNFDLLGQVRLAQQDSVGALRDFLYAIELYKKYPPEMPDMLVGYIHYRAALLHRYLNRDKKKALTELQTGLAVLDQEYTKLQKWSGGMETHRVQRSDRQYQDAVDNLRKFEREMYMTSPDLASEALIKFEKAVNDDPENYMLRVAYASLLENSDTGKAIAQYHKAIEIDDKQETALFNLGVLLLNKGVYLFRQASETSDEKQSAEWNLQGEDYFRQSLPWLEKAYNAKPNDPNTVRAILQVSRQLNDTETYQKYKNLQPKINGN
ncbi:MAG: hypothetical protein SF052_08315 [Bacteroidia bacterium]|nr:hypothetical protein [Bacteroidia bacterium]